LTKQQKKTPEDERWDSKNHGQSVRFLKRKQDERKAKELYEDGLKQLKENEDFRDYS